MSVPELTPELWPADTTHSVFGALWIARRIESL
jgi:hypothetical protein